MSEGQTEAPPPPQIHTLAGYVDQKSHRKGGGNGEENVNEILRAYVGPLFGHRILIVVLTSKR